MWVWHRPNSDGAARREGRRAWQAWQARQTPPRGRGGGGRSARQPATGRKGPITRRYVALPSGNSPPTCRTAAISAPSPVPSLCQYRQTRLPPPYTSPAPPKPRATARHTIAPRAPPAAPPVRTAAPQVRSKNSVITVGTGPLISCSRRPCAARESPEKLHYRRNAGTV